jgi:hypothetical protein
MSKSLAREVGIHEFQCQKASFLELMIDGLNYRYGQLVMSKSLAREVGIHEFQCQEGALPGAHD